MTRAALYFRQSLDVTEGIERQRTRCAALIAARGWTVVEEYADNDTSASNTRGPDTAWGRMLADAQAGRFDVVVSADLDRLLRSTRDLVALIDTGAKVVTIDGEIDLSTADGEFRATMLAGIARFEVRRKTERRVRANDQRTSAGRPQAGRGRFGLESDHMTVRESEASWVLWAHEQLVGGATLYSIAHALNEARIPSSTGALWSVQNLKKMLCAPRNAGLLVARGKVQPVSLIQPIVSVELHEQAVAILTAPGRGVTVGPKPELNWLSGPLYCSVCGRPMRGKNISRVPHYLCESKIYGQTPGERHVAMLASAAEDQAVREIFAFVKVSEHNPDSGPNLHKDLLDARAALTEIARQRATVPELALLPGADLSVTAAKLRELADAESDAQRHIAVHAAENAPEELLTTAREWGATALDRAEQFWAFSEGFSALPAEAKRRLWSALGPVEVRPGKKRDRLVTQATKRLDAYRASR